MEYKYHPIYKYLFFFVITYAFLKHQNLMENNRLLINSFIITIFGMLVDQMFIHNNLTIFQPLSDQYFDNNPQIKVIEKELEQELKDQKIIEKMKKKNKKKNKKNINEEVREKTFEDNNANYYNESQDIPYNENEEYERRSKRLPSHRENDEKHYTFYEPSLEQVDIFAPTESYNKYKPQKQPINNYVEDNFDNIFAYNA